MRDDAKYAPLRAQAKTMIIVDRMTTQAVADKLGVAKRTVCAWSKRYGWQKQKEEQLRTSSKADSLYDFMQHMRANHKIEFSAIEIIYKNYLNRF